jgi:hypothetical protein
MVLYILCCKSILLMVSNYFFIFQRFPCPLGLHCAHLWQNVILFDFFDMSLKYMSWCSKLEVFFKNIRSNEGLCRRNKIIGIHQRNEWLVNLTNMWGTHTCLNHTLVWNAIINWSVVANRWLPSYCCPQLSQDYANSYFIYWLRKSLPRNPHTPFPISYKNFVGALVIKMS